MNKNMISRIAVALVAIPLILWICYQPEYLIWLVALLAILAFGEILYNEKIKPTSFMFWLSYSFLILILLNHLFLYAMDDGWIELFKISGAGVAFFLLSGMIFVVGKESPTKLFNSYTRLFWGLMYIGLLYPYVFQVGNGYSLGITGGDWMLFLFSILWVGDSAALFVGKSIGKHKLAPSVSPNKTIEGFIGGLVGAIIVGVVMYFWKFDVIAWYHIILIAFGCSIFGQLGDLVESMWKRSINIKDSSNLIPGHGGILDRFDSLLFAAPFMYLYINLL